MASSGLQRLSHQHLFWCGDAALFIVGFGKCKTQIWESLPSVGLNGRGH